MFTFNVKPENEDSFEVVAATRDVLVWEKTTKGRTLQTLRDDASLGDLYKIAHIAARRQGLFSGTLQEFEDSVDLEFEEDEEEDPTRSGASTEA